MDLKRIRTEMGVSIKYEKMISDYTFWLETYTIFPLTLKTIICDTLEVAGFCSEVFQQWADKNKATVFAESRVTYLWFIAAPTVFT